MLLTFTRLLAATTIAVALSALTTAQQRPDFSGTWVATRDIPAGIAAAPTPVFGERFALRHTGQKLDLFRFYRDVPEPVVTTHNLDGAETRHGMRANTCFGQSATLVTTGWDGNAIAYEVTGSLSPGNPTPRKISLKYAFKLPAPDTLVVESTMRASASAEPTPVATVYKKSSEPPPAPARDTTPKVVAAQATLAQVEWFTGVWSATTASRTIEERWLPAGGGAMLATSRTMLASNGGMVAFEFLCVTERDGGLVYTAMPNAAPPTEFVLTKIDADSATFENPAHDFPKMIRYVRKPDGTMEATISGDADRRPTTFVFKKQQ